MSVHVGNGKLDTMEEKGNRKKKEIARKKLHLTLDETNLWKHA
jgi:hypothetical protein